VTFLTWWWSPRYGTSGSTGPLATLVEGYLGVRFSSADGMHYGWVHVRQTVVINWAYETRPGVPIRAGARAARLTGGCAAGLLAAEGGDGNRQSLPSAGQGRLERLPLDKSQLRHS